MTLKYLIPATLGKEKFGFMAWAKQILDDKVYSKGEYLAQLSSAMALATGYEYAIPTAQCTHALFICARFLKQNGIKYALAPAFTWTSTYRAFEWAGIDVRFMDIDPETWLVDFPDDFKFHSKHETVRIPVDTFGSVYPTERDFFMIDSAQSLGANWKDREVTRTISLSGSKAITAGEGGFILTQNKALADFAERTRGWFSRMPELSAALGLAYAPMMSRILEQKASIAALYHERFPGLKWQSIPVATNHYIVAAVVEDRQAWLSRNPGVEFRTYYDDTIIREIGAHETLNLPNTTFISQHILAFPAYPEMTREDVEKVNAP